MRQGRGPLRIRCVSMAAVRPESLCSSVAPSSPTEAGRLVTREHRERVLRIPRRSFIGRPPGRVSLCSRATAPRSSVTKRRIEMATFSRNPVECDSRKLFSELPPGRSLNHLLSPRRCQTLPAPNKALAVLATWSRMTVLPKR